jgi:hypothetical protein
MVNIGQLALTVEGDNQCRRSEVPAPLAATSIRNVKES